MASNSLLECLVFAHACATYLKENLDLSAPHATLKPWDDSQVINSDEAVVVTHNWDELRRFMWDYVGIVRSHKRLARAKKRIDLLKQEVQEYYAHYRINRDLLELRNLVIVADLIIRDAISRDHNCGLHFNIDLPSNSPQESPQPPKSLSLNCPEIS
jgi:L-aspartate oxidase